MDVPQKIIGVQRSQMVRDGRHASRGAVCIGINRLGGANRENACSRRPRSGGSFKEAREAKATGEECKETTRRREKNKSKK